MDFREATPLPGFVVVALPARSGCSMNVCPGSPGREAELPPQACVLPETPPCTIFALRAPSGPRGSRGSGSPRERAAPQACGRLSRADPPPGSAPESRVNRKRGKDLPGAELVGNWACGSC